VFETEHHNGVAGAQLLVGARLVGLLCCMHTARHVLLPGWLPRSPTLTLCFACHACPIHTQPSPRPPAHHASPYAPTNTYHLPFPAPLQSFWRSWAAS
jgi:hypothetical protein